MIGTTSTGADDGGCHTKRYQSRLPILDNSSIALFASGPTINLRDASSKK
jgi:hypothetical protein